MAGLLGYASQNPANGLFEIEATRGEIYDLIEEKQESDFVVVNSKLADQTNDRSLLIRHFQTLSPNRQVREEILNFESSTVGGGSFFEGVREYLRISKAGLVTHLTVCAL